MCVSQFTLDSIAPEKVQHGTSTLGPPRRIQLLAERELRLARVAQVLLYERSLCIARRELVSLGE